MNKFSSLKIMRRHWCYEAEHVIYCTPEMEPGSLSGSLFTQARSSVQGPGGVVPCSQAADKEGNSKSALIMQVCVAPPLSCSSELCCHCKRLSKRL